MTIAQINSEFNEALLIRKRKQISRLITLPYRKGINYLYLFDVRKAIVNRMLDLSIDRVLMK